MAVLGGEGNHILGTWCTPNTFDDVFVNFPDPPVWSGSKQRLLNEAFLRNVHRVLRPGCTVTVVTDDHSYCEMVAHEFGVLVQDGLFVSAFGDGSVAYVDHSPQEI